MLNGNFYPTPRAVIEQMCIGLDLKNKVCADTSAGSGNIVDYLLEQGAKEVLTCEIEPKLIRIIEGKSTFIKPDFFEVTASEVSHVDYFILNPPFDHADRHILHAYQIAPEGCEIISLCNSETLGNNYTHRREQLKSLIEKFGNDQYLGDVFKDAERKTDVTVSLVHLYKPKSSSKDEFEGYFDLNENTDISSEGEGVMKYDEIRDIVNRYVEAVKQFDEVALVSAKINSMIQPIESHRISFGGFESRNGNMYEISRESFKKNLQKSCWITVFNKMKMQKYVTDKIMAKINQFVEKQSNVPFTLKNIYKMVEVIQGTHGGRMIQVIVDAFDEITGYYKENRNGEGWKTNDCFFVNRRFILPNQIKVSYRGVPEPTGYSWGSTKLDDVQKALCNMTASNYDLIPSFHTFLKTDEFHRFRYFGQWYEWGFLRFKCFKKGTIHAEFIDEKVWKEFNYIACKGKGWQIPKTTQSDFRKKETRVEIYR